MAAYVERDDDGRFIVHVPTPETEESEPPEAPNGFVGALALLGWFLVGLLLMLLLFSRCGGGSDPVPPPRTTTTTSTTIRTTTTTVAPATTTTGTLPTTR